LSRRRELAAGAAGAARVAPAPRLDAVAMGRRAAGKVCVRRDVAGIHAS